jgi:hypothetical protein
MDENGKTEAGGLGHRFIERDIVHVSEVLRGRRHKCLESSHAAFGEHLKLVEVVRLDPTPQREVDQRGSFRSGELEIEALSVAGGRVGVERHLHEGGYAPRRERSGARREAFPVGAPRLAEVGMSVDRTGEEVEPRRVYFFLGRAFQVGRDRGDAAALDGEVCLLPPLGCNKDAAPDDQVVGAH